MCLNAHYRVKLSRACQLQSRVQSQSQLHSDFSPLEWLGVGRVLDVCWPPAQQARHRQAQDSFPGDQQRVWEGSLGAETGSSPDYEARQPSSHQSFRVKQVEKSAITRDHCREYKTLFRKMNGAGRGESHILGGISNNKTEDLPHII